VRHAQWAAVVIAAVTVPKNEKGLSAVPLVAPSVSAADQSVRRRAVLAMSAKSSTPKKVWAAVATQGHAEGSDEARKVARSMQAVVAAAAETQGTVVQDAGERSWSHEPEE
jgi:hypothetical protein